MQINFAGHKVKYVAQRAATVIQYRCPLGHNFALSEYFPSKLGILSAYKLYYIDKNYSMCNRFLNGAMQPVSLGVIGMLYEPRCEKTGFFAYVKTKTHQEADQCLCFRYTDSTIPLLPKSEISSL